MSCRPLTALLPFSNFLSTLAMFSRPILVLAGEAAAPAGAAAPPFWARSEPAPRYNPPPKATRADRHATVFFTESPPLPEPPGPRRSDPQSGGVPGGTERLRSRPPPREQRVVIDPL